MYQFTAGTSGRKSFYTGPTLDTAVLNQLTPQPVPDCIFPNQIVAAQYTRTCESDKCFGFDGVLYMQGDTETIYLGCDQNNDPCDGTLSVIAIGFNACPNNLPMCLTSGDAINTSRDELNSSVCNLAIDEQLHIIERKVINGSSSPTGNIAKIRNQKTGRCLAYDGFNQEYFYQDCDAPDNLSTGTKFLPNDGFEWTLLPSANIAYESETPNVITVQTMAFTGFDSEIRNASPLTVKSLENFYNTYGSLQTSSRIFEIPNFLVPGSAEPQFVDMKDFENINRRNIQFIDYRIFNSTINILTYPDNKIFEGSGDSPCDISNRSLPFFNLASDRV